MRFFVLSPEVAGGLGENTVMSRSEWPPLVTHLHYEFDGWLGDELVESFPCFLITKRLADILKQTTLTGYELRDAEISVSVQFLELHPDRVLPEFVWLVPIGRPGHEHIAADKTGQLVVSEQALQILKRGQMDDCEIAPWNPSSTN